MLSRTGRAAVALSAAALLAGCGAQETSGEPQSTSRPSQDLHGAPKVQNSLDTTAFHREPCSVLKPEQISALEMTQWKPEADLDSTGGPSCDWGYMGGPPDYTVSRTAVTFMVNGHGLKGTYSKRGKGVFEYFRELKPIEGYPAVAAGSTAGGTPEEEAACEVEVGVTDALSVLTQVNLGNGSPYQGDPCGRARAVATEVVQTLKAGA
ncbi:DUF3558 domain-containing protein [Halopolyspora algeriensis]|uniref:DUF3558 domain-containing protein n=1 Tax=Halopolyspora algeriensis TaxID=1500506 RepID=UPI00211DBAA0|nr:DUF3558 domain-containing protein [Halopolyspora algeriensis]